MLSRIEQAINQRLEKAPWLKRAMKDIYQSIGLAFPVRNRGPINQLHIHPGFFFGFHDLCPWSPNDRHLLAHRYSSDSGREGCPPIPCDVGLIMNEETFHLIASTRAWNWQEGSRLQWVGLRDEIVFNDLRNGRPFACRMDLSNNRVIDLDEPIHTVNHRGTHATTIDYGRISRYSRAYSYSELVAPEGHGHRNLGLMDLYKNTVDILVGSRELPWLERVTGMPDAYHYCSHTTFSPGDCKLGFLLCWLTSRHRYSKLVIYDLQSGRMTIIPSNNWTSHYCWLDDSSLLVFDENTSGHRGYRIVTSDGQESTPIAPDELMSDGHPQATRNGRWVVLDTYPDRHMCQELLLYDRAHARFHRLLRTKVPYRFRYEYRCDFHPRWNRDGTSICFDSAHTGVRSMCVLHLDDDLEFIS